MTHIENIRKILMFHGLKITPQRIAVLEAVMKLKGHPTADHIIDFIQKNHPNIAVGTVYKILETLVDKKIIKKVKTDRDIMRYDAVMDKHHHLYCAESDIIKDYFDTQLDEMLAGYFARKKIPYFKIEEIKLQIIGKFMNNKS